MDSNPAPLSDPQTMPLDQLRDAVTAPAPEPQPVVEAAPAPADPFSVQQDDAGLSVQMSPEFGGEVFKGKDWAEVGPKIAKAKADANAYIKTLKSVPQPAPVPAPVVEAPIPQESAEDKAVREWLLEQNARALGISKDQYVTRMTQAFENSEKMQVNLSLAEFHQMCPDYQDTPENTAAIAAYFPENMNHFPTAAELKQAYALAVYENKIKRQAPAAPAPIAPPPMPGTSGGNSGSPNPWTMDMEALRRSTFNQ